MSATAASHEILVISSFVVRGSVGARAGFILERLGHRVWTMPTIILPWHPGHGRGHRIVPAEADFAAMLADLARAPWLSKVGAVVSGYLGAASQAGPIADLVRAVKAANPDAIYLCDPVLGDIGSLYVPEDVAKAQRDILMPLADLMTPNAFEVGWLTGGKPETMADLVAAARTLGPRRVVVTSAPAMMRGKIATALVSRTDVIVAENRLVGEAHSGTGDLFAAQFLSALLTGRGDEEALRRAVAGTFEVVARSVRAGAEELDFTAHQDSIAHPMAEVDIRRWATPQKPARRPADTAS